MEETSFYLAQIAFLQSCFYCPTAPPHTTTATAAAAATTRDMQVQNKTVSTFFFT
jgi:hypothetical protein